MWQLPLKLSCTVNCTRIGKGPDSVVRLTKTTSQGVSRSTGPLSALNEPGTRLPFLDHNWNWDPQHPYRWRTWIRGHLPWFLINLGVAAKAKACDLRHVDMTDGTVTLDARSQTSD